MKQLLLLLTCALFISTSYGQLTGFAVETYQVHDGTLPTLDGMTTYRVYALLTNPADEISAIYGDATAPLSLSTSGTFWQSPVGENFGWAINAAFFGFFPDLEFDSWLTLGAADNSSVVGQPNSIGMDAALSSFNAGNDLVLNTANGGSWFTLFGDANAQAGDDLQVLIAQLTTESTSVISGNLNVQIFVNGVQANSQVSEGVPFSSDEGAIFGCMDPDATNYNPDATEDGEPCIYPCALSLSIAEIVQNSCPGVPNGEISVTASGGQLGVLFGIDDDPITLAVGNFDELIGGIYTVNAIDGAGCEASIEVEIVAPTAISVAATMTESVSCAGDADAVISGSASGGTGTFTFSLSNSFSNPSDNLVFGGLGAGLYTVYAMDENGCVGSSIGITISNPPTLQVSVIGGQNGILDATCSDTNDGMVNLTTIGGSGTSAGMQYSSDGVNFAPGSILYVGGGVYNFYAMDVNGCIAATVNQYTVDAPAPIVISANANGILCNGDENGSVSFSATGGNGGLTFDFNNGGASGVTAYSDLAPGTYDLLVTDVEGCTNSTSITVNDITAIVASATVSDISCFGEMDGSVEISASGGTGLFEYSDDGSDFGSSPVFTNLTAGDYMVYAQDSNGCVASVDVSIEEPAELSVTGTITNDTGAGDGELDITVSGGNGGYSYDWSGPNNFSSSDEDLSGIIAGEYTVVVTDNNGCETSATFGVPVGISEWSYLQSVVVSPNPSNGLVNVKLTGATGEDVMFNLFDGQGRMVSTKTFAGANGVVQTTLDFSSFANGFYQLQLISANSKHTVRLMKQ